MPDAMRLSVLIVEDHDALRELTQDFLLSLGHEVRGAPDGETMDELMALSPPDIVVLDVNLPGEDGHSICARLRAARPALGIVMLTARASVVDRVNGYDHGADVYLAKPTAMEELAAAILSLGRRMRPSAEATGLTLVEDSREITGPGGRASLSEAELRMMRALLQAPGRQLEHWQLLEVLGLDAGAEAKAALEVRMVRLRKKLAQAGAADSALQAQRGVGYRLAIPVVVR